jgi:tetratricopeptide (TPR) repeat protein
MGAAVDSTVSDGEKSKAAEQPREPRPIRTALLSEALGLYIHKIKREDEESRSWIRQPNNFISVVAIVLSLASLGYGLLKDYDDGIDKNLQSLSTAVVDLTKLDSDVLTPTFTDPQRLQALGLALNNRRIALLAEADRLIADLGNRVPIAQLAVLGPEYVQVNDYATAIKYFTMTAERASSPTLKAQARRSMAIAYEYMGPDYYRNVREAFGKALELFPDPKDVGSTMLVATIYEQWAQFEAGRANYTEALARFADARRFAMKLPCPSPRADFIAKFSQEVSQALAAYHGNVSNKTEAVATLTSAQACF